MRNRFEIKVLDKETGESWIYDGNEYLLTVGYEDDGDKVSGGLGGRGDKLVILGVDVLKHILLTTFAGDKEITDMVAGAGIFDVLTFTAACLPTVFKSLES